MHNKVGAITDFVNLQVQCGPKVKEMRFLVTDLGEDEIILGYPWLAVFQPDIDWKASVLAEELQPLVIKTLGPNIDAQVEHVTKAWIKRARSMAVPGEEVFVTRLDTETLRKMSTVAQMAANAKPKEEKTWVLVLRLLESGSLNQGEWKRLGTRFTCHARTYTLISITCLSSPHLPIQLLIPHSHTPPRHGHDVCL